MTQDPTEPRPLPARPGANEGKLTPARAGGPRPTPARPPGSDEPRVLPSADAKPTPVRQVMEAVDESPAQEVEADVETASVEAEGRVWEVRVLGRSLAGASTQLLLLGFSGAEEPGRVLREGWAVGRTLAGLTEAELRDALAAAAPPREPGKRPFFDEGGRRSRRDG